MRQPARSAHRLAVRAVEVSVLALPAGDVRRRYERELIAEMYSLDARRQAGFAAMTLATAWSLRRSLEGTTTGGAMTITRPRKSLPCMIKLHKYVTESTEDGVRFQRCRRCGQDRYRGSPHPFSGGF